MKIKGDRRIGRLERSLMPQPLAVPFTKELVTGLPEPARRYLLHSIAPGMPLARSVRLQTFFRMRLRENDQRPAAVPGEEVLAPPRGFVRQARAKIGLLPVRVQDHYKEGTGGVNVRLLGLIPVLRARGTDVSRSARGRLAGEAICPSALLPSNGVEWGEIDAQHPQVTLTIDGDAIPLRLRIDEEGRLREMSMLRHGDVGVESWQPTPYGAQIEDEATFGGYTIPTRTRGGWWYGTGRYKSTEASVFQIVSAVFE